MFIHFQWRHLSTDVRQKNEHNVYEHNVYSVLFLYFPIYPELSVLNNQEFYNQ